MHITKFNSKIYNRRSIRLKGYDYSKAGFYFITICSQNRKHLFGKIDNDIMILNAAGIMINRLWNEISSDFQNVNLCEYVTMPNHIHGIIQIAPTTDAVGADSISAHSDSISAQSGLQNTVYDSPNTRADMESAPTGNAKIDIPRIIQSFKRHTTIEYIKMVKQNISPPFEKRIWQRNYWEHIIRNKNEYYRISKYINNNPNLWACDKLNGGKGNIVMEETAKYDTENWMT
jgi:REP element-mobilizing transposase RayT